MRSVKDKAVLLRLRDPKKVTEVIPKSKELVDNKVLVNWGLDEVHVLKNLNIVAFAILDCELEILWTKKLLIYIHIFF